MKIKHYSRRCAPEIRERLKEIISLSHKNRVDSNSASSSELFVESFPHAKGPHLEIASSIRKEIEKRKKTIQANKDWIERKSPGFFKRTKSISKHITTWDLDMPAIRFSPVSATRNNHQRKKHPRSYILKKREADMQRRRDIMNHWYCFFFGRDHLKSPLDFDD